MFTVYPRICGVSDTLRARYERIPSSTLGHLTDFGAVVSLRPVSRPVRMIGNAVTVRIPHVDGSILRRALEIACAGDVLVVDMTGDERRACWGEWRAYAALEKRLAGIVVSGCVTDIDCLSRLKLPVFSRGVSPLTTRNLKLEGEINTPIAVDGVTISPGDLIVGDDDGLFALSPARAAALIDAAADKEQREAVRRDELRARKPGFSIPHDS